MIKILILTDDDALTQIVGLFLGVAGYQYIRSDDINEALAYLRVGSIDLFIMSSRLPDGTGWEELYEVVKQDSGLSGTGVILLWPRTGVPHIDINAQGDAFIGVPFPGEDLLTIVEQVLKNYGNPLPTAKEMENNFSQNRAQLARESNYSEERLIEIRQDLLQKLDTV